jgi:hypothetical protein
MQEEIRLPDGKGVVYLREADADIDNVQRLIRESLERAFKDVAEQPPYARGGVVKADSNWFRDTDGTRVEAVTHPGLAENPKDALGRAKPPLSTVPVPVLFEMGAGLMEGAAKYARHNYRVAKIRASVYYDAALRHLMAWWEGEDIDPESGVHHVGKTLSCLAVLRDAQMNDMIIDDRPPVPRMGWMARTLEIVRQIQERNPDPLDPFTQKQLDEQRERAMMEEQGHNPT